MKKFAYQEVNQTNQSERALETIIKVELKLGTGPTNNTVDVEAGAGVEVGEEIGAEVKAVVVKEVDGRAGQQCIQTIQIGNIKGNIKNHPCSINKKIEEGEKMGIYLIQEIGL